MSNQIQIKQPEIIGKIFEGDARYRVAYGGRGSGKSYGFATRLLLKALEHPRKKFLCCREIQNSVHDSVHAMLIEQVYALGLTEYFDIGINYLRTMQGAEFVYRGLLRNSAEIKSMQGVQVAWVEEAQSVSHKSLDVLLPTVREPKSEIWFTFNPEDESDAVYETFVANERKGAVVQKVNYVDNPFFPDVLEGERLNDLKNKPKKYNWIWLGDFNRDPDGAVYAAWIQEMHDKGRVKKNIYEPDLPVHTAWDLGYGDSTAIWFYQVHAGEVRLIDYYFNNNEDIQFYCEQLYGQEILVTERDMRTGAPVKWVLGDDIEEAEHRKKYRYGTHFMPHDAANKILQAGGRSTVKQAHDFGIKVKVVGATTQKNQIEAARSTLEHCWVDPDMCKDGIRALRRYKFEFDDAKQIYKKDPLHDDSSHGCDAFEIIGQVWRTPAQKEEPEPPKFFEQQTVDELFYGEEEAQGTSRI